MPEMNEEPYVFTDERFMTALEKRRVLRSWRGFIRGGFRFDLFTKALYHHLIQHGAFIAHYDREGFWRYYFGPDSDADRLMQFLHQFGGDKQSVEYGGRWWLTGGTGADLNAAMCREMERVYPALMEVLTGLARQYESLSTAWGDDATRNLFGNPPRAYRISGNIRALLAAAAAGAIRQVRTPQPRLTTPDVVTGGQSPPPTVESVQLSLWVKGEV